MFLLVIWHVRMIKDEKPCKGSWRASSAELAVITSNPSVSRLYCSISQISYSSSTTSIFISHMRSLGCKDSYISEEKRRSVPINILRFLLLKAVDFEGISILDHSKKHGIFIVRIFVLNQDMACITGRYLA